MLDHRQMGGYQITKALEVHSGLVEHVLAVINTRLRPRGPAVCTTAEALARMLAWRMTWASQQQQQRQQQS
jgi:hypothetical protein